MKPIIKIYSTPLELSEAISIEFSTVASESSIHKKNMYIALAGGSSPKLIYESWANLKVNWRYIHFFWGDERCVPPEDADSNYQMVKNALLDRIDIPEKNIHRIFGENSPDVEIKRYQNEILQFLLVSKNSQPKFDWIFLGIGEDGHTASLFPGMDNLQEKKSLCIVTNHPDTGQKRISLTLQVINNAKRIAFIVTGEKKARIVQSVLNGKAKINPFPAGKVFPSNGVLEWYLDKPAAKLLK